MTGKLKGLLHQSFPLISQMNIFEQICVIFLKRKGKTNLPGRSSPKFLTPLPLHEAPLSWQWDLEEPEAENRNS